MSRVLHRMRGASTYICGAGLLVVGASVAAAMRPTWFVTPTGRIPLFGGPVVAMLFVLALWYRSRFAYALTLLGLALWASLALERYRDGTIGWPAAQLGLAVAMLLALVLLVVPAQVRREFFARSA